MGRARTYFRSACARVKGWLIDLEPLPHTAQAPSSQALPQTGALVYAALSNPKEWIHRRVESVSFLDESTVRRRVSVDLTVTTWSIEGLPAIPLPLARLDKRPLAGFSLMDESGRSLPSLTTQQNGDVASAALVAAAETVLEAALPDRLQRDLRAVAFAEPGALALDVARGRSSRGLRADLFASQAFNILAADLEQRFLLITQADADTAGDRRIIKYEYVERFPVPGLSWRQRLGWHPVEIEFDVPLVGMAESYHFEIEAPAGLMAVEGWITTEQADAEMVTRSAAAVGDRIHLQAAQADDFAVGTVAVHIGAPEGGL